MHHDTRSPNEASLRRLNLSLYPPVSARSLENSGPSQETARHHRPRDFHDIRNLGRSAERAKVDSLATIPNDRRPGGWFGRCCCRQNMVRPRWVPYTTCSLPPRVNVSLAQRKFNQTLTSFDGDFAQPDRCNPDPGISPFSKHSRKWSRPMAATVAPSGFSNC